MTVKRYHRYVDLIMNLAFTVLAVSFARGQDCPCNAPASGMEYSQLSQPDLVSYGACGDEMEHGVGNNVAACSGPFCGHACRSEGIFFSTETMFVNVQQPDSHGLAAELLNIQAPAAPDIDNLNPDLDLAARFIGGYQTCDGLGFQVRYWEFDTATALPLVQAVPADPDFVTQAWDVNVFDAEVVWNSMINQVWDKTLSAGYRFVSYEEDASIQLNNAQLTSVDSHYIGNGVTGALGLRRQWSPRFSLMGNARTSLLLGDQNVNVSAPASNDSEFDARFISETQLGVNYEHGICGGGYWFARGGYELQYWNDFVPPLGTQVDSSSTILHGLFLAFGLQR
jgi:hypothetical protein